MRTTLHHRDSQNVRIHGIIRGTLIILFSLLSNTPYSFAQKDRLEKEKKILFLSCLIDETSLNGCPLDSTFDYWVNNVKSEYQSFGFEASKRLNLHYWGSDEYDRDVYSVQLFKIPQENISYYVLRFESTNNIVVHFWDTVWIRVSGYTECDLKIFFDRLIQKGMSIDRIRSMINVWCKEDPMFDEVDWNCLINGYIQGKPEGDCYRSNIYSMLNALCIKCNIVLSGDNSTFSRTILYGYIMAPDI